MTIGRNSTGVYDHRDDYSRTGRHRTPGALAVCRVVLVPEIAVRTSGNDVYEVTVTDADGSATVHSVTATTADIDRWGGGCEGAVLVEASFRFLLDREPKEAILTRFDLPVIARYFPEYPEKIGEYLTDGRFQP